MGATIRKVGAIEKLEGEGIRIVHQRGMSESDIVDEIKRLYLDGHKRSRIQKMLGLSDPEFRRYWVQMKAQLEIIDYGFTARQRREIANAVLTKLVVENQMSEDYRCKMLALRAAEKILIDPEVKAACPNCGPSAKERLENDISRILDSLDGEADSGSQSLDEKTLQ